jgi:hypothetical protein
MFTNTNPKVTAKTVVHKKINKVRPPIEDNLRKSRNPVTPSTSETKTKGTASSLSKFTKTVPNGLNHVKTTPL